MLDRFAGAMLAIAKEARESPDKAKTAPPHHARRADRRGGSGAPPESVLVGALRVRQLAPLSGALPGMTGAVADGLFWTAWPLRRRPIQGAMAVVIVVGSCWGVWSWTNDPWMVALAVVVFAVTLASFFVPTTYHLSREGVEIRRPWRTRRRSWQDFRGIRKGDRLLVLSPFAGKSWLDGIRGETLLLEDNRGEVLEYVEAMVGKETGAGSG